MTLKYACVITRKNAHSMQKASFSGVTHRSGSSIKASFVYKRNLWVRVITRKNAHSVQKESLGPRKYAQKESSACKTNLFFGSTNERRVRHPFGSVQAGLGVLVRAHFLGGSFSKQRPVEHPAILLAPSCSHPPTTNNQQQSQWRPRGGPPCPALRASSPTSRAPSRP